MRESVLGKPGITWVSHDLAGGNMLNWALTFFIVAIIAAVLGFGGIAGTATGIAKFLFMLFVILFLVSLIVPRMKNPPV